MKKEDKKSSVAPIPEPRIKLPILGHLLYLKGELKKRFVDLSSSLGPIYRLKLGPYNVVVITGLDFIREVCDDSRFTKYLGPFAGALKNVFKYGFGFLSTDDPNWGPLYRILLPGLQQKILHDDGFPLIVKTLDSVFTKWDNALEEKEFNLNDEVSRIVIDVIGLFQFNYDFNSINSPSPPIIVKALDEVAKIAITLAFQGSFLSKLSFGKSRDLQQNLSILYKYADEIIENRKKLSTGHKDLVYNMLYEVDKTTGEKFEESMIRNQICGLLLGGVGTTINLVTFALFALMTHPIVLKKAYAEVDRTLGSPPVVQNFSRLTYIHQILDECLRIWPPAPVIERGPIEDTFLGGKYLIKKGESIWTVVTLIHSDKALWGDDAESFNPDRFAQDLTAKRDPVAYLPFGVGRRACIGRQFSLFAATIILGMILQKYELHLRPGHSPFSTSTLTPPDLWVTPKKRKFEKPIT